VQYPAPSGPYKVSLKNNVPWQGAPEVRLQISVGKAATEGDKFYALCEWAAARFPRAVVIVSDTLQRHNLQFESGLPPQAAWAESAALGSEWLVRNRAALSLLPEAHIMRWDTALAQAETAPAMARMRGLYETSAAVRSAVDTTVAAFWARQEQGGAFTLARQATFAEHSRAFLLEELAVFSWLCRRDGVDAYAGSWLEGIFKALNAEAGTFGTPFGKGWVQVDYTRNKAAAMAA
jgi:tRNA-dependent cyclodipeptide synthase